VRHGLANVAIRAYPTDAAMNLKRLAAFPWLFLVDERDLAALCYNWLARTVRALLRIHFQTKGL